MKNYNKISTSSKESLYNTINMLRNNRGGKSMRWNKVLAELIKMQGEGTLNYPISFKGITDKYLTALHSKLEKQLTKITISKEAYGVIIGLLQDEGITKRSLGNLSYKIGGFVSDER